MHRPLLYVFLAGLLIFGLISVEFTATLKDTVHNRQRRENIQLKQTAEATHPDLGDGVVNLLGGTVFPALQEAGNRKLQRHPVPITSLSDTQVMDVLDQVCRRNFPRYHFLEFRGATLDRDGYLAAVGGNWRNLGGKASLILNYDGMVPGTEVGLPADPTLYPFVAAFTCTVPYELKAYRREIPEDGDLTNRLGSLWRPLKPISNGNPDRWWLWEGRMDSPALRESTYASSGEVRCWLAIARPQPAEPVVTPVEFPATDPPCDFSNEQVQVMGNPYGGGFVLITPCGGILPGVYTSEQGANDAVGVIRNGGDLKDLQSKLQDRDQFLGRPSNRSTPRYPPGTWTQPQLPPSATQPGAGGVTMVPPGSNLLQMRVMFNKWIAHSPGPYTVR